MRELLIKPYQQKMEELKLKLELSKKKLSDEEEYPGGLALFESCLAESDKIFEQENQRFLVRQIS